MSKKIKKQWLKKTALGLTGRPLARQFERASHNVARTQKKLLDKMVRTCKQTAFGRDHEFERINSTTDYQRSVPIRDFEGHRRYIERMMEGEEDVLFPGRPLFYNTTSGTASKPKQIPISKEYFEKGHKKISRLWFYSCLKENPGLFSGFNLSAVGAAVEGHVPDGTPFGSLSGMAYKSVPGFLRDVFSTPYPVICIEDYQKKYYGMIRCALARDLTYIVAANPSSLLKFHEVVTANFDDLVRDIREGTLRFDVIAEISAMDRPSVLSEFRPDPERADELERLMAKHGDDLRPKHYWPNLKCINTWKQGNCAQLLPKLEGYFPEGMSLRELGYQASEARAGLTLGNDWDCSVLAVHIYHFEFIEESRRDDENPEVLLAHQLEEGKRYYMIISNMSGLYRYDINDVIEVTGFYNQIPMFRFLRKGAGFASLTGEKITETQVLEAMERARRQEGIDIRHFNLCCDEKSLCYKLFVELDPTAGERAGEYILEALDDQLQKINPEYECKRGSERLAVPILQELPEGSYEMVKNELVSRGMAREGQYKSIYLERKPEVLAVYEQIAASRSCYSSQ
ncbi:MAG: GH3 auxin-responsive promoter family protein [Proteobacteria bacterium]|nr:GH3 auxin-responsive promoter family protein [Pseudomonadota bacterium]